MKKLIISVVLSTPLFLTGSPSFSAPISAFDNSIQRFNAASTADYANVPKAGTNYAWYRWHHHHYWHRGHHWHHWHHWHHYG